MVLARPLVTWMAVLLLPWSCREVTASRRVISDTSLNARRSPPEDGLPHVFFAGGTYFFTDEHRRVGPAEESRLDSRGQALARAFGEPRQGESTDKMILSSPPPGFGGRPFIHAVATRLQQQLDSESSGHPRTTHTDDSLMYVYRLIGGYDADEGQLMSDEDMTLSAHLKHRRPGAWSCGEVMVFFLEYAASLRESWSAATEAEQTEWLTSSVQKLNAKELYHTFDRILGDDESYGFVMVSEELQVEGFKMGRTEGRNSFGPSDNDNHIYGVEKYGSRCYLVEQNVGRFHIGHLVAREDTMDDFADTCCEDVEDLRRMRVKYGMSGLGDLDDPMQGGIPCSTLLKETLQPLYDEYYDKSMASTDYDEGPGRMSARDVERVQQLRSELYGLSYDFKKLDVQYRGTQDAEAEAELPPGRMFYRDYPAHAAFTLFYHANA